jgi:transposase InsO family protein
VLGQSRCTQRYTPKPNPEEDNLVSEIRMLALRHPRYGYKRVTALLRRSGWKVNRKRVHRIWRREGLKVPVRKRKKSRLWLEGGRSVRLKPRRRGHVWCYDFAYERTEDGRPVRILTVVDEYTREALAARAGRTFPSRDVIEVLGDLMLAHGVPEHIRSDSGPEFIANEIRSWLGKTGVKTCYIKPGAPWENAFAESFISRVRDELLDREIFFTLKEAQVMLERFRVDYNTVRPHSALGYQAPLEAIEAAA